MFLLSLGEIKEWLRLVGVNYYYCCCVVCWKFVDWMLVTDGQ